MMSDEGYNRYLALTSQIPMTKQTIIGVNGFYLMREVLFRYFIPFI